MEPMSCSGCYRMCYGSYSKVTLCPECGRELGSASKEQQRAFSIYIKERHFSPNGLRIDRADIIPNEIADLKRKVKDLELELISIRRFIDDGIDI